MAWQGWIKSIGKGNLIRIILAGAVALVLIKVFAPQETRSPDKPFTLESCLETTPAEVDGLKVIAGSRSKASIIKDMVPLICRSEGLFKQLQSSGEMIKPGSVTFQVSVEFNGEVITAKVVDNTIESKKFIKYVSRFINEIEFSPWNWEETDTVFLYPAMFGQR